MSACFTSNLETRYLSLLKATWSTLAKCKIIAEWPYYTVSAKNILHEIYETESLPRRCDVTIYFFLFSNLFKLTIGFKKPWSLVSFLLFVACDSNPCLNGGTCIDETNGKYSCACAKGWKGDQCESKEYWLQLRLNEEATSRYGVNFETYFQFELELFSWSNKKSYQPSLVRLYTRESLQLQSTR